MLPRLPAIWAGILFFRVLHCRNVAEPNSCLDQCECKDNLFLVCNNVSVVNWPKLQSPYFESIRSISITNSELEDISLLPDFQLLETIDFSHNHLHMLEFEVSYRMPAVKTLIVAYNGIRTLEKDTFAAVPYLVTLDLSNNQLEDIEWDALRLLKLKRLSLAKNDLRSIDNNIFRLTPSLEEIDLSYNELWRIQVSEFSSAQRLKFLNLSHNLIRHVIYDSFAPFNQLETLDLSYNRLSSIPKNDLTHLIGLRSLILKGNPIITLAAHQLVLPSLQLLDVSHSSLKVVSSLAFGSLPSLNTLNLANNENLTFISSRALENASLVFSLDISNCALRLISPNLLQNVAQAKIDGNPLDCGCAIGVFDGVTTTISDFAEAQCVDIKDTKHKLASVISPLFSLSDQCPPAAVLPMGDTLYATVGSSFTIHCATKTETDVLEWTLPNGTTIEAQTFDTNPAPDNVDFFSSTLYSPIKSLPIRPRLAPSKEFLRIDVVMSTDAGVYECSVVRGRQRSTRRLKLIVKTPKIQLKIVNINAHSATVSWNDSLRIDAADRVALHLIVSNGTGIRQRAVQLSLRSPWLSYNLLRLRPATNYSLCLKYSLVERAPSFGVNILNNDGKSPLPVLETCIDLQTSPSLSYWEHFSTSTLIIIILVTCGIIGLFCFHTLFARSHVWQHVKQRARMNLSLSGQSFVSNSTSAPISRSVTYDNNTMQTSCHLSSLSSNVTVTRPSSLPLNHQDIAV